MLRLTNLIFFSLITFLVQIQPAPASENSFELCAIDNSVPKLVKLQTASQNTIQVIEFSEHFDVHFTAWELENYIRKNYTYCTTGKGQEDVYKLLKRKFRSYSYKMDKNHSVLWVRNWNGFQTQELPTSSAQAGFPGIYLKMINPEKGRYLVPDARAKTVKESSNDFIRKDSTANCATLGLKGKRPLYKEVAGKFVELQPTLDFPLFKMGEWAQLYPGYAAYVNTSWYDVYDQGPHTASCTTIYGTTVNSGEVIQGPVINKKESLGLFAVMKTGKIQIIPRGKRSAALPFIEHAFSGIVVQKKFQKMNLDVGLMDPKERTHRTAFALDRDGNLIVFNSTRDISVASLVSFLRNKLNTKDILIADGGGSSSLLINPTQVSGHNWIYTGPTDVQGTRPVPSILAIGADLVRVEKDTHRGEGVLEYQENQ